MLTCPSSPPKNPQFPLKFPLHPLQRENPMESSTNRPSPRQLQGPRPTPLRVRKDSYKINKKPPTVPNNSSQPPPQPPRQPVIIYTVSPKVIHTNPADFMTLVQRLTGPAPAADPSIPSPSAALSPAARFAAFEKPDRPSPRKSYAAAGDDHAVSVDDGNGLLERTSTVPGILSPQPSSLRPISPSFFSPIAYFDPGSLGFLNDLSPFAAAGGGGGNNNFMAGPSNYLSTPTIPSPGSYWDLFNDF